jgi:hypothetical protein
MDTMRNDLVPTRCARHQFARVWALALAVPLIAASTYAHATNAPTLAGNSPLDAVEHRDELPSDDPGAAIYNPFSTSFAASVAHQQRAAVAPTNGTSASDPNDDSALDLVATTLLSAVAAGLIVRILISA